MTPLRRRWAFALVLLAPFVGACKKSGPAWRSPSEIYSDSAEAIASAAFDPRDDNRDKTLDAGELEGPPPPRILHPHQPEVLSSAELTERISAYQASGVTAANLPLRVLGPAGGAVEDASVVAVPEDFHRGYPTLEGKCGAGGLVTLTAGTGRIPYGFYRITVSKPGGGSAVVLLGFFPEASGRGGPYEIGIAPRDRGPLFLSPTRISRPASCLSLQW